MQMQFNPDKCEVIRITNRRGRRIDIDYTIHGTVLREVSSAKYLGVTIDSKLTWNAHIANVIKKANNQYPAIIKETVNLLQDIRQTLSRVCLMCVGSSYYQEHLCSRDDPATCRPLCNWGRQTHLQCFRPNNDPRMALTVSLSCNE